MSKEKNDFQRNADGSVPATLSNVARALAISTVTGKSFAIDGRRKRLVFDHDSDSPVWRDFEPVDAVGLRYDLETLDNFQAVSRELLEDALLLISSQRTIDPFKELAKESKK